MSFRDFLRWFPLSDFNPHISPYWLCSALRALTLTFFSHLGYSYPCICIATPESLFSPLNIRYFTTLFKIRTSASPQDACFPLHCSLCSFSLQPLSSSSVLYKYLTCYIISQEFSSFYSINKSAYHHFMAAGKRHQNGSERKNGITYITESHMNISIFVSIPLASSSMGKMCMGSDRCLHNDCIVLQEINPELRQPKFFYSMQ